MFAFPVQAQILTGYVKAPPPKGSREETNVPQAEETVSEGIGKPSDAPVDLQADNMVHDEQTQTVTASGDVMIVQDNRILRADEISYNLKTDTVHARGHVVLNEPNGDIHYSEEIELTDKMKDGFVNGLKSYLNDGSRFTAERGDRSNGNKTVMRTAMYTPCEPCKKNPDKDPIWQIKASKVTHDEEERKIAYNNARFEVFGVPIAYTPYFSHPDGSIDRKSGFLSPSVGYKSELGAFVEESYYWNIAPDKDATIGAIVMTEEMPLGLLQYRQRWDNAGLEFNGGITESKRIENKAGVDQVQDEELRGHIMANALWNMNDKWRSGFDIEYASDDQYMRQYDFSNEDVLESQVFTERFSGRNYAVGRLMAFQDIRVNERQADQPQILPEIIASFYGEPNSVPVLKGRWSFDTSFLGLQRNGDNQDMNRFSLGAGWQRRLVSDYGLLTQVNANARSDFYNTRDRDVSGPGTGQDNETTEIRFFPNVHVQTSYPMARQFENSQMTIEPIVALTVAPNIDTNNDIPNEDSQDAQIDAGNLFEPNRFPGIDRVEDRSRVTYGVRTGLYGYGGSYGDVFLGQSYRLDEDDNPFPEGSGLDEQESDIVGQVSARVLTNYNLDYRFQLASDNLTPQRHEVDLGVAWDRFSLNTRYLYAKGLEGTDVTETREQLQAAAGYYVSKDWRVRVGGTQDMGDDSGLRHAFVGLDYFGQCASISLTGERSLTDDNTGDSDTEILLRIGLKNLGEFETSGLRVDSTEE
jgi:LPS-assembly protein